MAYVFPDLSKSDDLIVHLELDDGTEGDYMVIIMFECRDLAIAGFIPADTSDDVDEAEVFFMEMANYSFDERDGEIEFQLENIDDPDLYNEVGEMFQELVEDMG